MKVDSDRVVLVRETEKTPDAEYRLLGRGSYPAVVVPGGPLLGPAYLEDLGGLAAQWPLAVPVLPRVRFSEVVDVLEAVRNDLGLDTVDVLAHSAGASAALCYLAEKPNRVRRLILITPAVSSVGIVADPEGVAAVLDRRRGEPGMAAAIAASEADPGSLEAQRLSFGVWGTAQSRLAAASLVDRAERLGTYYADPRPDPASLQTAARTFDGPVTIVRGEVDVHPTQRQAEALASYFRQADILTIPSAGHYPWLDHPQLFVNAVLTGLRPDCK